MTSRALLAAAIVLGGACASAPTPVPPPVAPLPGALHGLEPLLGDWQGGGRELTYTAAPNAVYGIAFDPARNTFELAIYDEAHDHPGALQLERVIDGASSIEISGPQAVAAAAAATAGLTPRAHHAAPELEAADRAFAADVAAHGAAGWVAAFDERGATLSDGKRETHAEIAAEMDPLLAAGTLAWAPIASGRTGAFGFTVGTAQYNATTGGGHWRSSYLTIWHVQPDGRWKVMFDTGRSIPEPAVSAGS